MERTVSYYSDGVEVHGTLHLPEGGHHPGRPCAAVVLVHGWGSYRDDLTGFSDLAAALGRAGLASLRMDLRGCGMSGVKGRIHPDPEWIEDTIMAVTYLASCDEIDKSRIGLVGMSVGGGVVCQATALDERIKAVVALAPVANGRWWLCNLWREQPKEAWDNFMAAVADDRCQRAAGLSGRCIPITEMLAKSGESADARTRLTQRFPQMCTHVTYSSVERLLRFQPHLFVPAIGSRPLFLIHSLTDDSVPIEHSYEIFGNTKGPRELYPVIQSPHSFWIGSAAGEVIDQVVRWLPTHI